MIRAIAIRITGDTYEWHPGDPMEGWAIIVWHMTRSRIGPVRRWAIRYWGA